MTHHVPRIRHLHMQRGVIPCSGEPHRRPRLLTYNEPDRANTRLIQAVVKLVGEIMAKIVLSMFDP